MMKIIVSNMNQIQDLNMTGRDLQQQQMRHDERIVIGGDDDSDGNSNGVVGRRPLPQQEHQQHQQQHKGIGPTTNTKSLSCSNIINNGGRSKRILQSLKKWNKSAAGGTSSFHSSSLSDEEEEQGCGSNGSGSCEIRAAAQTNNDKNNHSTSGPGGDDSTVDLTEFHLSANSILTSNVSNDSFMLNSPVSSSSKNNITVPLRNSNARHPSIFSPEDPSSDLEFHGHHPLMSVDEDDASTPTASAAVRAAAAEMETRMENSSQSSSESEAETKQAEVEGTVSATTDTSMDNESPPAPMSDAQSIAVSVDTPLIANTTTPAVADTSSDEPTSTLPSSNLKIVRWGTIQIYEHVITMGLTSIPSCGAPISLSNEPAQTTYTFPIDEYESLRVSPPRKGQEMLLTRRKRSDMLLELGFTMTEIAKCVRETQIIQQQRAQSAHRPKLLIWWQRLKHAVKKVRSKKAAIVGRKDDIDSSYTSRLTNGSQEDSDTTFTADEGRLMVKANSEVDLFIQRAK